MGRKKIVIKRLEEDRNRNVTFLKRKAGLMKKAWELSVLCGAEVSVIIFSQAGKLFEFSSSELDDSIQRYHEYAGPVERRRSDEFAALAGNEDQSDGDDEAAAAAAEDDGGAIDPAVASQGQDAAGAAASNASGGGNTVSLKGKQQWKEAHWQASTAQNSTRSSATAAAEIDNDSAHHGGDGGGSSSRRPSAASAKGKGKGKAAAARASAEQQERRDRRRSGPGSGGMADDGGNDSGTRGDQMGYAGGMAPAPTGSAPPIMHRQSLNSLFSNGTPPPGGPVPQQFRSQSMSGVASAPPPFQLNINGGHGSSGYGAQLDRSMFTDSPASVHPSLSGGAIDWEKAAAAAQLQASLHAQQAQLAYLKQQQLQQESWMRSVGMLGAPSSGNEHPPLDPASYREPDFAARMQQTPYMEQLAHYSLHGGVEGKTAQLLDDLARAQQQQASLPSNEGGGAWTPEYPHAAGMVRMRSGAESHDDAVNPYKRTRM